MSAKSEPEKTRLQFALFSSGRPNWTVARDCGLTETRLSRIASGRLSATITEQARIAAVLGRPVEELFEVDPS